MLTMVSCAWRVRPLAYSLPPVTCSAETEITCSRCLAAGEGWMDGCSMLLPRRFTGGSAA
jgi:hypothetical protein